MMANANQTQDQALADKTARSVFVGNIPYEVSEEKLKEIFSEVGPVLSFKLVFDRESGKPKGYGFCEYKDQETALSAMRNLNNYEIGGRSLRVDNACTEKSRMEMQSLFLQSANNESQYGPFVTHERAPETISKAVASLPPEQMYELMKQMKQCIQNNPSEARQMLLQNPQLAYALLQAQIVMRIVDPQTAFSMLHQKNQSTDSNAPANEVPGMVNNHVRVSNDYPHPPPAMDNQHWNNLSTRQSAAGQPISTIIGGSGSTQAPPLPPTIMGKSQDLDMRMPDFRAAVNRFADQDLRIPPSQMMQPPSYDHFARDMRGTPNENFASSSRTMPPPSMGVGPPLPIAAQNSMPPRLTPGSNVPPLPRSNHPAKASGPIGPPPLPPNVSGIKPLSQPAGPDSEKAALIMQVLQLTDEQITMLPAEQRQSILVLKEQIAKSTKQR